MAEPDDPQDAKLITLARGARARTDAAEGAAVRDLDGRSYAAATVDLPSLKVSAVGVAVATAVSSGARGLEAAAVVSGSDALAEPDLAILRDLAGADVAVWRADLSGAVQDRTTT
ncbi:MAG: cytidine deaminase [Nocardioidaceae bacterium]